MNTEEIEYKFVVTELNANKLDKLPYSQINQCYIDGEKAFINFDESTLSFVNSKIKLPIPKNISDKILDLNLIKKSIFEKTPISYLRIRIKDNKAFFTVKGQRVGMSSPEIEFEIDHQLAKKLLKENILIGYPIEKYRYIDNVGSFCFEIDIFKGFNEGLVIAEVEVESENVIVDKFSDALIKYNSTDNPRFFNSNLSNKPFIKWADKEKYYCNL